MNRSVSRSRIWVHGCCTVLVLLRPVCTRSPSKTPADHSRGPSEMRAATDYRAEQTKQYSLLSR